MPRVTFLHPEGKSGIVTRNLTILDAAKELGFPLTHDCGGNASCTTCRVEVQGGWDAKRKYLEMWSFGYRKPSGRRPLEIQKPRELIFGKEVLD